MDYKYIRICGLGWKGKPQISGVWMPLEKERNEIGKKFHGNIVFIIFYFLRSDIKQF